MSFDPKKLDKIKLVISDLDGTLLDKAGALSEGNREAIFKLKNKDILFTFATGRMDKMTWHFAQQLDLDLPIISCNGSMMRYLGADDVLYRETLTEQQVKQISEYCTAENADYVFYSLDTLFYVKGSKRVEGFIKYNNMAKTSGQELINLICLDDCPDALPTEVVTKSYIIFPAGMDANSALGQRLSSIEGITMTVSGHGVCDIMPEGTSKGTAMEKLAEILEIDLENVLCIGDQQNDISMMQKAGVAVGMRSGAEEIREHVDLFAEHNNADGLGRLLTQIFELY